MSNLFTVDLKDVGGAVLSAVIVAVLGYLGTLTNVFEADLSQILNIAILTATTSILKSLGTNSEGKFLGGIKVK